MNWPNFVGPSYVAQSPTVSAQELINFFVQRNEAQGAKAELVYFPTPGFIVFAVINEGPLRGQFAENGRMWAVSGSHAYEVFADGTTSQFALALATDGNPATIASNGAGQLFVTCGGKRYIIDTGANTLVNVAGASTQGASLNGYFLSFDITTGTFAVSTIFDGTSWPVDTFALRSLAADPWRSMQVVNGRIYFLGEKTSEIWGDSGDFPMPFAPITTTLIMYGVAATFAAGALGDTLSWLANSEAGKGLIVQTRGLATSEIQTAALSNIVSNFPTVADARVWTYEDRTHEWFVFDFPSGASTYVTDTTSPQQHWHRRGLWDAGLARYGAWGPAHHCQAFGKHLVGDRSSGTIYEMSPAFGLDFGGVALRRLIQPPALFDNNNPIFPGQIELIVNSGLGVAGVTGDPGVDPQVSMRMSRNGGGSWGNWRNRSAGAIGEYGQRVQWATNPSGFAPVPQFVFSDPVPWVVIGCTVDVQRARPQLVGQ